MTSGQMKRLLRDIDLPSLTLGVLPIVAGVDITEPDELALRQKAFNA